MSNLDLSLPLEANKNGWENGTVTSQTETTATIMLHDSYGSPRSFEFDIATGVRIGDTGDNPFRVRNTSSEVANHYFRIFFGHESWPKEDWRYACDDLVHQFADGKTAAIKAKEYNKEAKQTESPWRFMVKPYVEMSPDHKWREWMISRFETGEYEPLPWAGEPWVKVDHFAHVSKDDPFRVAYVNNERDGVLDKIVAAAPGAYLQSFYGDVLTPQQISAYAVALDKDCELHFAKTPEEIAEIYKTSGMASCMSYSEDKFSSTVHPVSVYGAGDLELAYLKRKSKIIARAIVRPSNKAIGRIYGDQQRLTDRLIGEGWTYTEGNYAAFVGAKLLKVQEGEEIVMPYLDWNLHAKDHADPAYLELCTSTNRTYSGQSTTGIASGRTIQRCANAGCGATFPDGGQGVRYHHHQGRSWCAPCSTEHLKECSRCEQNVDIRRMPVYPFATSTGRVQAGHICQTCVPYASRVLYDGKMYQRQYCTLVAGAFVPSFAAKRAAQEELT